MQMFICVSTYICDFRWGICRFSLALLVYCILNINGTICGFIEFLLIEANDSRNGESAGDGCFLRAPLLLDGAHCVCCPGLGF